MRTLAALLMASLTGCYLAHEGSPAVDAGSDAPHVTPADTGRAPSDAARGPDVGILPPDPEPDGSVDVPPDAWRDDASSPSSVTLMPVGDPISLDDSGLPPGERAGAPQLVWNGAGWGVLWNGTQIRLRELSADGTPSAPSTEVADSPWPGAAVLAFGAGRYAVTVGAASDPTLRLFDRNAHAVLPIGHLVPTRLADVARLEGAHRWVVIARGAGEDHSARIAAFDDEMHEPDARITIAAEGSLEDDSFVRIAAIKTRALTAWVDGHGLVHGMIVTGAPLAQASPILEFPGLAPVSSEERGVAIAPTGARLLLAASDARGIEIYFVDPWTYAVTGPFAIAGRAQIYSGANVAPIPERGVFGLCWGERPDATGQQDRYVMQVMDERGMTLGDPVVVADHQADAVAVACGWNGTDFVVAWFTVNDGNHLYSQRVHPTFQ